MKHADTQKALIDIRRKLQLARAQNDVLEKKVIAQEQEFAGMGGQPFFYSAIGSDGQPGVLVDPTDETQFANNNNQYSGFVNIEEDAAFVWTHVGLTRRFVGVVDPTSQTEDFQAGVRLLSTFRSTAQRLNDATAVFHVGFVDTSSGRVLFQSKSSDNTLRADGLLPTSVFDVNRSCVFQGEAPGHGAEELWALPKESVLAASGALEVRITSSFVLGNDPGINPEDYRYRVYTSLFGYKFKN